MSSSSSAGSKMSSVSGSSVSKNALTAIPTVGSLSCIFNAYRTASAVNGVPSWNVTPSRILKSHVVLSSEDVHDSARDGT